MNEMNETAREKKLAEIAETVEKFKAENPEAAARAEAEAAAWVQKQMKKQYPFENAVETLRAAGASLSDAIRKAAAANPADHDDYLRRAAEGSARPLAGPR